MGYNKKVLRAIDRELKDRYRSKRYSKSLSATNSLFAPNYLFSKPSKRRIYNPNAKYFKHGGPHGGPGDPPEKKSIIIDKNDPNYVYKDYAKKYGVDLNSISIEDIEALIKNQQEVSDYWKNQTGYNRTSKPTYWDVRATEESGNPAKFNEYAKKLSKYHTIPGDIKSLGSYGWEDVVYEGDLNKRRDDYPIDLQNFILDNATDNVSYIPQLDTTHGTMDKKQNYDEFPLVRVDDRFPNIQGKSYYQNDPTIKPENGKLCEFCPDVSIPQYDPVMLARLQNQKILDDWSYEEVWGDEGPPQETVYAGKTKKLRGRGTYPWSGRKKSGRKRKQKKCKPNDPKCNQYKQRADNRLQHGGPHDPIPVTNPDDPRLHMYLDSLNLYKGYLKEKELFPEAPFTGSNITRHSKTGAKFPVNYYADAVDTYVYNNWDEFSKDDEVYQKLMTKYRDTDPSNNISIDWNALESDPKYKSIAPRYETNHTSFRNAEDLTKFSMKSKAHKNPGDGGALMRYYDNLSFRYPAKVGSWHSPDLGHSKIQPLDSYLGEAWNPIYAKPVQPYYYTGPKEDVEKLRGKVGIYGIRDFKSKSTGTLDPKKSVNVNLIKLGLATDTKSANVVKKELYAELFPDEEYKGKSDQNIKLNEYIFDNNLAKEDIEEIINPSLLPPPAPPQYEIEPVAVEPEISPLPVMPAVLPSDLGDIEIVGDELEEEFDNNYKGKRVVNKEKHYKVNKKGKFRRGPFGKKTIRRVGYEMPEEEQIYPEGFVPRFEHGGPHDPLSPEYLKSHGETDENGEYQMKGFEKAVNEDLDSLLRGSNTDGYDSHWYGGEAEGYGVTSDVLRGFASDNRPKSFVNAAAYAKAMNELSVNAGGKRNINIPFADNPIVMRTDADDLPVTKEYVTPETLQEQGYIDATGTNAVNQYQSYITGLAKRYTQFKYGGVPNEEDPPIKSIFDPRYKEYFKIANNNYKAKKLLRQYDKNWEDSVLSEGEQTLKEDSIVGTSEHRDLMKDIKDLNKVDSLEYIGKPPESMWKKIITASSKTKEVTKLYNTEKYKPKLNPYKLEIDDLPWGQSRAKEDEYRKWVVENYPEKAKEWDVDDESPLKLNNKLIRSVFYELGPMPDPIQPPAPPVYDIEPVYIEPEIEIEKLDIIQPELTTNSNLEIIGDYDEPEELVRPYYSNYQGIEQVRDRFNPKRRKGVYKTRQRVSAKIAQALTGYDAEKMDAEIEAADKEGRRINFENMGLGAVSNKRFRKKYNKEYDKYEEALKEQEYLNVVPKFYNQGGYAVEEMHEGGNIPDHEHPHDPPIVAKEDPPNASFSDLTDEQQDKIEYMQNHSMMSGAGLRKAINAFAKNNPKSVEPEIIPYQYPKNTNASEAWDVQNRVFPIAINSVNNWYTEWYKGRKTNPKFADLAKKRYEAAFFRQTPFVLQSDPDFRASGHDAKLAVTYVPNVGDPANKPWENKIIINNAIYPDMGNNDYYNSKFINPAHNMDYFKKEGVHEKSHWDENNYPQEGISRHTIADDKVLSEIIPEGFHSNKGTSNLWSTPESADAMPERNTNFKSGVNLDSRWGSYISRPTEVRARLNVWRENNNISPTKDYSIEELQKIMDKNVKDSKNGYDSKFNNIIELYHVIKGDPKLLKQLNDSYVKNEETSNVLDDQYAKEGGSVELGDLVDEATTKKIKYKDGGPKVKQRKGVRENPDGTVSSHLMRAEQLEDGSWVAFPSLFQDENGSWVDMSEEENWYKILDEAEKRGEVYEFGDDKFGALAFGEGSWKPENQKYNLKRALELGYEPDETGHWPSVDEETGMFLKSMDHPTAWKEYMYGQLNKDIGTNTRVAVNPEGHFGDKQLQYIEAELTDKEAEEYRLGGYILEEMHEGGNIPDHEHPHKNPSQSWKDVKGTPSKRTKEQIKLDKDLEESVVVNKAYINYLDGDLTKKEYEDIKFGFTPHGQDRKSAYTKGVSEKVLRNITPQGYGDLKKNLDRYKRYQNDLGRNKDELLWYSAAQSKTGKPIHYKIPKREDMFSLYLGLPQKNNSFSPQTEYKPTNAKDPDALYWKPNYWTEEGKKELVKDYLTGYLLGDNSNLANERTTVFEPIQDTLGVPWENPKTAEWVLDNPLGDFTVSQGKDDKGHYISIYDIIDFDPFKGSGKGSSVNKYGASLLKYITGKGYDVNEDTEASSLLGAGKPYEIYDRIYYNPDDYDEGGSVELGDLVDKATMQRLKEQGYTFQEI